MPGEYGRGHSPYNPELTEFTRSARTATRDAAMLGCACKIAEAIVKALAAGKNSIARDWQNCQVREFVKLEGALVKLFRGEPALLIKPQEPNTGDIGRWFQPPHQGEKFGDREGEAVMPVALVVRLLCGRDRACMEQL